MKKLTIPVTMIISAFFVSGVFAATIELKDGKKIIAEVLQETDDAVVVSKNGGSFVYSLFRDRIKAIRESTPEELQKEVEKKRELTAPAPVKPAAKTGKTAAGDESAREKKVKEYRLEQYEKEVEAAKKARGKIKIKFKKDRFGVVDVKLNGKVTASMLADTGASLVVISRDVANELGLTDEDEEGEIPVVLADGRTTTATAIKLDSVEVGAVERKDVEAAITEKAPGSAIDGLLGMSFLRYFDVKLDAKENTLILQKY